MIGGVLLLVGFLGMWALLPAGWPFPCVVALAGAMAFALRKCFNVKAGLMLVSIAFLLIAIDSTPRRHGMELRLPPLAAVSAALQTEGPELAVFYIADSPLEPSWLGELPRLSRLSVVLSGTPSLGWARAEWTNTEPPGKILQKQLGKYHLIIFDWPLRGTGRTGQRLLDDAVSCLTPDGVILLSERPDDIPKGFSVRRPLPDSDAVILSRAPEFVTNFNELSRRMIRLTPQDELPFDPQLLPVLGELARPAPEPKMSPHAPRLIYLAGLLGVFWIVRAHLCRRERYPDRFAKIEIGAAVAFTLLGANSLFDELALYHRVADPLILLGLGGMLAFRPPRKIEWLFPVALLTLLALLWFSLLTPMFATLLLLIALLGVAATKTETGDVKTCWYLVGAIGAAAVGTLYVATPVLFALAVLILLPRMLRI